MGQERHRRQGPGMASLFSLNKVDWGRGGRGIAEKQSGRGDPNFDLAGPGGPRRLIFAFRRPGILVFAPHLYAGRFGSQGF